MPSVTGTISRSPTCSSGSGESISIIDPKSRRQMPPTASTPKLVDLDLEDEQHQAEQDQQHARIADRQHLEGEKRQQQADAAGDAGQDRAGLHSSIVRPSVPSISSR